MYTIEGKDPTIRPFIVGTGGVTKGGLVTFSAGTVIKATSAPTAGTIVGIADATVTAGGTVGVEFITGGKIVRATYTGSTKTTLADADLGKVFDLTSDLVVNLDDVTGGACHCVGYDNLAKAIDFFVPASFMYV